MYEFVKCKVNPTVKAKKVWCSYLGIVVIRFVSISFCQLL